MVYLFKAFGLKIQGRIDNEIKAEIEHFDPINGDESGTVNGYHEFDWEIEALPDVTMEQAQTVFKALWRMTGEIDPDYEARLFEK